ncbi:MAG: Ppx/GppA phosphatase family protein [Luminiphilus sp.]|nr:Ppx/GppA phosphatase family protein [Luminiphilus sp.]
MSDASQTSSELLAAIDLGSNSFHLMIAKPDFGELRPIHALAEKVQLGETAGKPELTAAAITRGLLCLERFKQLIDSISPTKIRVVGTNALRRAKNRQDFIEPAEHILGVPVDVIYGREEARLIYLGVAHTLSDDQNTRLVIDIGGGSTEFILGERFEPTRLESLQLGCVSYGETFFPGGGIDRERFDAAYHRARIEVSHIRRNYHSEQWQEAVGSSGTLRAIEALIVTAGWRESGIDRESLNRLRRTLLAFERVEDIDLEGLSDTRKGVVTAGLAIAMGIFDGLQIQEMRTSSGALREGVIYDLIGRFSHEDVRNRTIVAMQRRYSVDQTVANLVTHRVGLLATATQSDWHLAEEEVDLLKWAGALHELGIAVSQKNYSQHSAYLVLNTDLPGFAQQDQEIMAALIAGLKGKPRSEILEPISKRRRRSVARMMMLLRLAVILKHVEVVEEIPDLSVAAKDDTLTLTYPREWGEDHPLTIRDVEQSVPAVKRLGITLTLKPV